MELHTYTINYKSKTDKINIIPLGDAHFGNLGFQKKRFLDMVEWIRRKDNTYTILMGDLLECVVHTDKRFDPSSVDKDIKVSDLADLAMVQANWMIKALTPIKHKIIGIHAGNHEEKIRIVYHQDITNYMAIQLGVRYLGYEAFTRLRFKKGKCSRVLIMNSAHGSSNSRKAGGVLNIIIDKSGYKDADIMIYGHTHKKFASINTKLSVTKEGELKLQYKKSILGNTGSFLDGYTLGNSSYVERMDLPPSDLGVIKIEIIPYTGDLHCSE